MIRPIDRPDYYFNFTHPHHLAAPGSFRHRLGNFKCTGVGQRVGSPIPQVFLLHVPVADFWDRIVGHEDTTAERMAAYLANPPENIPGSAWYSPNAGRIGSVHGFTDTDSGVVCLPIDSECFGCGNPNTRHTSFEVEISGTGKEPSEYWRTDEAKLKFVQAARLYLYALQLYVGPDWKDYLIPLQRAELAPDGTMKKAGFTQHREVPYWNGRAWAQPPVDNLRAGQHSDICENFPYDALFEVFQQEIDSATPIDL